MFRRDLLCYDSIYCSEEIHFVTIQCTFSEMIQWYYSEKVQKRIVQKGFFL